ncbi:hypothetical protein K0M31_000809 [Melipona bicolor]|uniref:Uncharacterized protein n=1 Tax=Melipona bicolor TaxID=60889 RepID=A0AA40GEH0_9HYME|nr:hypothetical protein K0M31_000809 [Melipona bicolor]
MVSFMRQPTSDKGHTGHTCRRQFCLQGGPCKPRSGSSDSRHGQRLTSPEHRCGKIIAACFVR